MTNATDQPVAAAGDVVVIGAGPAGLTAAYELGKRGATCTVLEADDVVGGISRTVRARRLAVRHRRPPVLHQGARGRGVLARDPRPTTTSCSGPGRAASTTAASSTTTRIRPLNALRNLGPIEAVRCALSFLWVTDPAAEGPDHPRGLRRRQLRLAPLPALLQDLQREGVGACPPSEISADWGAQRIKGMSLWSAVWEPLRARLAGRRGQGASRSPASSRSSSTRSSAPG